MTDGLLCHLLQPCRTSPEGGKESGCWTPGADGTPHRTSLPSRAPLIPGRPLKHRLTREPRSRSGHFISSKCQILLVLLLGSLLRTAALAQFWKKHGRAQWTGDPGEPQAEQVLGYSRGFCGKLKPRSLLSSCCGLGTTEVYPDTAGANTMENKTRKREVSAGEG